MFNACNYTMRHKKVLSVLVALYQDGMVILLIILFLLLSIKVNEEITDHGCDEQCIMKAFGKSFK